MLHHSRGLAVTQPRLPRNLAAAKWMDDKSWHKKLCEPGSEALLENARCTEVALRPPSPKDTERKPEMDPLNGKSELATQPLCCFGVPILQPLINTLQLMIR